MADAYLLEGGDLASDNFDRANAADLGANWTAQSGETTCRILTNQAANTGTSASGNYYSAITWPDDQYSQAVINTLVADENEVSVRARCSGAARTYYAGGASFRDFSNDNHRIWKCVAGTFTSLATEAVNYTPGSTYKLTVQGTTIKLFKDGVEILSASDGTISSGSAGIGIDASTNNGKTNDWVGGAFTTTDRFLLEDGSGVYLLEQQAAAGGGIVYNPTPFHAFLVR